MAWPGMLVDPARASAQTRQGWWFECSAVWSAVKRGDEEVLKLLLASIARCVGVRGEGSGFGWVQG